MRGGKGKMTGFWVTIDSYHDRRTGYEFAVNPAKEMEFTLTLRRPGHTDKITIEDLPGATVSDLDFTQSTKFW